MRKGFTKNVFINCPFDEQYYSLLRPLLFTIVYLRYNPRISSERSDSLETRISKICALIDICQYSIHDLSRIKSVKKNEFYRMNMPFELGIEYGGRSFGDATLKKKKCLILERDRYDLPRALSDLAGVDVKSHSGEPQQLVGAVRSWFVETVGLHRVPSPTVLWYKFTDFMTHFHDARVAEGFTDDDLRMMPVPEYIDFVKDWVADGN